MSKLQTAWYLLTKNRGEFCASFLQRYSRLFKNDERYLKLLFRCKMGYWPNMQNPSTYSEKLMWLKLYNKRPEYTKLVDKYSVKEFVSGRIGNEFIIPTLGVWNRPEEIEWDVLPNQFVLKTAHSGGNSGVVICKDKSQLDKEIVISKLNQSLKMDIYQFSREYPYKDVPKCIIAEKYMENESTKDLRDYKFFCFDGVVKALFVATDRQEREEPYFNFFDSEYNPLDIQQGHPVSPVIPEEPASFELMKEVATKLSSGIPHVRVDLYEVNGQVYFGEMTFFHFGGTVPFHPESWDRTFGDWLVLPSKNV